MSSYFYLSWDNVKSAITPSDGDVCQIMSLSWCNEMTNREWDPLTNLGLCFGWDLKKT